MSFSCFKLLSEFILSPGNRYQLLTWFSGTSAQDFTPSLSHFLTYPKNGLSSSIQHDFSPEIALLDSPRMWFHQGWLQGWNLLQLWPSGSAGGQHPRSPCSGLYRGGSSSQQPPGWPPEPCLSTPTASDETEADVVIRHHPSPIQVAPEDGGSIWALLLTFPATDSTVFPRK